MPMPVHASFLFVHPCPHRDTLEAADIITPPPSPSHYVELGTENGQNRLCFVCAVIIFREYLCNPSPSVVVGKGKGWRRESEHWRTTEKEKKRRNVANEIELGG